MGVFSKIYLRMWDGDVEDICKVKRIKMHKAVHEILSVSSNKKTIALVVYEDGTTESLDTALESRKEEKNSHDKKLGYSIENAELTNGIFSFVKKSGHEKFFCYTSVDKTSLKSDGNVKSIKLDRSGQKVRLMGLTVLPGKTSDCDPHLITLWSDKRLFKQLLNFSNESPSIGALHAIVDSINADSKLAVAPISADCIAIYASKDGDDGSFVLLYNLKYKIIQSKVPFKVYLSNFKMWTVRKNIFLAMGEQLSVIPYRITTDHLSSMVGSQCDSALNVAVEKEMVNEDVHFEENLEMDENQEAIVGMEFHFQNDDWRRPKNKSKGKTVVSANEVSDQLEQLCRKELVVDLTRLDHQAPGLVQGKLLTNVDEAFPVLSENFELLCMEYEKFGCSEIEITNKLIPILIKLNQVSDLGLLFKRYNHVSEQMLVKVIKFLLSFSSGDTSKAKVTTTVSEATLSKQQLSNEKKVKNANVFLNKVRDNSRDVLPVVICCSFDSKTMVKFLRNISLDEAIQLMDHLYETLVTSSIDETTETRGNLVDGTDFDLDTQLFEWMKLLLDSHYQRILLSRDSNLHKKLALWLKLVDDHIKILADMSEMRHVLAKLSTKKAIFTSKKCNQWYTIEKLELY